MTSTSEAAGAPQRPDADVLIAQYGRLVAWIARRYYGADRDDLIQEGYLGLLDAAEAYYEPSHPRPVAFASYATPIIRKRMLREVRRSELIPHPADDHEDRVKIERARQAHLDAGFGEPTTDQIAARTGLTPRRVRFIRAWPHRAESDHFEAGEDPLAQHLDPSWGESDDVIDARELVLALPRAERLAVASRFGVGGPRVRREDLIKAKRGSSQHLADAYKRGLDRCRRLAREA